MFKRPEATSRRSETWMADWERRFGIFLEANYSMPSQLIALYKNLISWNMTANASYGSVGWFRTKVRV
jgi:hypothetical protein